MQQCSAALEQYDNISLCCIVTSAGTDAPRVLLCSPAGADEWYDECTKEQWKAGMAIMASLGQVLTEPDWRTVNLFDE